MAPFESLFHAASASVRQALAQASAGLVEPANVGDALEWAETAWGFYDSSNALRSGLEVTEHSVPPALLGLLQNAAGVPAATAA